MLCRYWPLTFPVICICFLILLLLSKKFLQLCSSIFFKVSCPCYNSLDSFILSEGPSRGDTSSVQSVSEVKTHNFVDKQPIDSHVQSQLDLTSHSHVICYSEGSFWGSLIYLLGAPQEEYPQCSRQGGFRSLLMPQNMG